ncbi:hypothetical protein [Amycolatopsis rifamycinica]|uniref:Uncharacterized protein n=1 Tax=Amycolatopsis rifamycinica TaxID=287986 RepID=A0A066U4X1_9PSEU|nr:hypothetical protein [Amycolatopsis rifamycinica]KDN20917.1 hypothetical protein DV20_17495 [Amycolatopsis rifamycinica]
MGKQQGRRIGRRTAEQVLRGVPGDAPDALAGLLAAAAAPPRDGEQTGEPAAMTAFREAAQHAPAPLPRSPSMIKTRWARLLTVKVAAAAAAVFTVGGVAAAAVTGALPFQAGDAPSPAPAASSHAQPTAGPAAEVTTTHAPVATRTADQPSPSPSLAGLCHAYSAGDKAEHGKALESPAFTALITAAGDRTKVDGYCDALLKEEAAKPAHPTGAPADPGGKDHATATHPAGAPSTHPTGPPTTRPTH